MRTIAVSVAAAILLAAGGNAQAARKGESLPAFRLCVLDRAAILRQSRVALAMAAQFQQIRQQAQADFELERRSLDADSRTLDGVAASLTPAELKSRRDAIALRRARLADRGEQINRNLSQLDAELTGNIATISAPTVRAVEAERNCSMSIARDALLSLNDTSFDITAAVIDRMNGTLPSPAPR